MNSIEIFIVFISTIFSSETNYKNFTCKKYKISTLRSIQRQQDINSFLIKPIFFNFLSYCGFYEAMCTFF